MRVLVILIFIGFSSVSCIAQGGDQDRACFAKANTQLAMDQCASQEAGRVEKQRNDLLQTLLSKAASQPEAVAKIKAAEADWILYRAAYIEAMFPAKNQQEEYGTMFPMEADLLFAKLTERHITDLKELLTSDSLLPQSNSQGPDLKPNSGSVLVE